MSDILPLVAPLNTRIVSRISYALSAWVAFLVVKQINRTNAFFKKGKLDNLDSVALPVHVMYCNTS